MAKHGKKYTDIAKLAPAEAVSLEEAIAFVKAHPGAKFDETMEMGLRMGCDPRKSDQMVRGTVSLPHGTGKKVRVAVFAGGAAPDGSMSVRCVDGTALSIALGEGVHAGWGIWGCRFAGSY